jgi:hypothetical protein
MQQHVNQKNQEISNILYMPGKAPQPVALSMLP